MLIRLRLLLRKLLAVLVMVSLLPGLPELVESLDHLLHDGHLPHSEQHDAEQHADRHDKGVEDEHGCTPMSHQCACHVSVLGVLADATIQLRGPLFTAERRPIGTESHPLSRANAPPTRPPIA